MIREEYFKRTILIIAKIWVSFPPLLQPERSSGSTLIKGSQIVYAKQVLEAVARNLNRFPGIAA